MKLIILLRCLFIKKGFHFYFICLHLLILKRPFSTRI